MLTLRQAAIVLAAALVWAAAARADMRGGPNPPTFTPEEMQLIGRDARLTFASKTCPWQLRRALDAWDDIRRGVRPAPLRPGPCRSRDDEFSGRASDEAALDILKILKEAAGQGTSR
jgi:hypothetical protein